MVQCHQGLENNSPVSQAEPPVQIINLDFYDPLDSQAIEDVTEFDLLSIIDDNLDYCAKIYDCNPLSNYDPEYHMENDGLNSPRNKIRKSICSGRQEILIPFYPVLESEEVLAIFAEPPEPNVYECSACNETFSDYGLARYHTDVTCNKSRILTAKLP